MSDVLDQIASTLRAAEADSPASFDQLPAALRQLANQLQLAGQSERSDGFARQATTIERLRDDPHAMESMLILLSREIVTLQLEDGDRSEPTEFVSEPTNADDVLHGENADLVREFFGEALEHLDAAEQLVLELEKDRTQRAALDRMFRHVHSIKGTARFIGLSDIGDLAQVGEDVLDFARHDIRVLEARAIQLLMDCNDAVRREVMGLAEGGSPIVPPACVTLELLASRLVDVLDLTRWKSSESQSALTNDRPDGGVVEEFAIPASDEPLVAFRSAERGLVPRLCLETQGQDALPHVAERDEISMDSKQSLSPVRSQAKPENECLRKETPAVASKPVAESNSSQAPKVLSQPKLTVAPNSLLKNGCREGEAPAEPQKTSDLPRADGSAGASPSLFQQAPKAVTFAEAVRVDRGRLDQLIDLVGELVICESMVQESCGNFTTQQDENRCLHQLQTITRELQELSLGLRMVPIQSLFQKGQRLVRDLSKKVNKPVDVVLVGEDTEMDKTIVDQISDPLVHILRNSMDHGIETSVADRVAAGKPERATICLKAFHQSGDICIEISDDGRGLNRPRIRAKAIERGLIKSDQPLTDDEVCDLIFRPGFSTAEQVTDLSGRGVGMDVVRQNITALRGTVQVSSVEGQGTRLLIRLPLTLGIIDGMIVQAGSERLIVPTSMIVELIQPQSENISHIQQRGELLNVRGQSVPFFRLDHVFDLKSQRPHSAYQHETLPPQGIVVVVEDKDRMAGLYVDQVLGRQQVVIKGLQAIQGDLRSFAGCAVLPDGLVGLILDVPGTLERARRRAGEER